MRATGLIILTTSLTVKDIVTEFGCPHKCDIKWGKIVYMYTVSMLFEMHRITMFWWYDCSPRIHNWTVMSPPLCLSKYWEVRIGCQMGTRQRWLWTYKSICPAITSSKVIQGESDVKCFNSCPGFHVLCWRNILLCSPSVCCFSTITATPIYNTGSVLVSWPHA